MSDKRTEHDPLVATARINFDYYRTDNGNNNLQFGNQILTFADLVKTNQKQ